MGELQLAGGAVADGMDAPVRCFQLLVDDDAGFLIANAGRFKPKPIDRRLATGGDKKMRALDFFFTLGAVNRQRHFAGTMRDRHHLDRAAQHDAIAFELVEDDCRAFGIVLGERPRRFADGDGAAETAERLRHFQTDRSTADDNEMRGQHVEIENGFVGETRSAVETRDRRQSRRRTGGDDKTAGANFKLIGDGDGALVLERRVPLDHAHAQSGKALGRIDWRDRGDHALHMRAHLSEIDRHRRRAHTERRAALYGMRMLGRRQQRLRRHAAGVEAVAAHFVIFDQHDGDAERGRRRSHRQPAAAAANHTNVRL